ncbi:hypothetical protein FRC05_004543 [Tulasnella sp. 425]|nr:hypothetical protein FRC05_004543 [Tulasnella sp. 425]
MQMHLSLEKAHSSALTLFQDLIDTILNAADSARLHSWFISYEVLHQSSQTPEPLLAIMLVFASDAYVLFGAGMSNAGQLNGTPDVPLEQRLRIVCNMLKSYGGLNVRKTLKHIVQAFRKYKAQQQPGHKMHVCLIEQALLFSKDPSLESASNSLALVAIYAVDLVLSLIKPARESLSADKRVVANSNVSRCLEVLLEIFALMSGLEMWGSSKHENVITDPGSDHPSGMVDPEGSDRSWYIDLYDKLQSAFEELASAEVASARPASQWVLNIAADPADPPVFNTQGAEMDPGPSKSAKGKEKETFEDVASAAPREEDGGNPGSAIDSAAKTVASDRGEDS